LAINARDAIHERRLRQKFDGTISITAKNCELDRSAATTIQNLSPGSYVKITIEDNGGGISEENMKKLFTPFFTTKPVGKGTGLGLASVLGTVQQSFGGVQVQSKVPEGTCFTLYFPRHKEVLQPKIAQENKETVPVKKTILVVDDEVLVGKSTKRTLVRAGHTVIVSDDPVAALDIFEKNIDQIDMIITDMKMPHLSGPEFVEETRKKKRVPVIFMSGYGHEHFEGENMTEGEFVEKPFDSDLLNAKIQAMFKKE